MTDESGRRMRLIAVAQNEALEGVLDTLGPGPSTRAKASQRAAELELLLDAIADAVLVLEEGVVVSANLPARELLGNNLIGRPATLLVSTDSRQALANDLLSPTGIPMEYALMGAQPPRWISLSASPMGDRRVVLTVRDVTAARKQRLVQAHQERLASIGTLAAGVAHEINNPLCFLLLSLETLRDGLETGDPEELSDMDERLEDALVGARRVKEIVGQLRTLAHPGAATAQAVALDTVVRLAARLAGGVIPVGSKIEVDVSEDLPLVVGNVGPLSQVVLNLLTNAAHAMGDAKGTIRVEAAHRDTDKVVLRVHDEGPGIHQKDMERIFDPFFTTKPAGKGTGLGLSLSRRLLQPYQATLKALPTDRGACFELVMRVTNGPQLGSVPTKTVAPTSPVGGAARLMVVDDEPRLVRSIVRALRNDFDVIGFEDAEEALRAIAYGDRPDVILSDVLMPGLDGLALLSRLRQDHPELANRVVFMSGDVARDARRTDLDGLPNLILDKPLDLRALRSTLHKLARPEGERDRRAAERHDGNGICAFIEAETAIARAVVLDFSSTGLRLRLDPANQGLSRDEAWKIHLTDGNAGAHATMKVRWVRDGEGVWPEPCVALCDEASGFYADWCVTPR
ncbi:MAG: signal transduction histidine kinase/DNA-binding response OmpR family regulator [Cognaticolwellia sp.]|jgi:signal transduction histidine kinase/DNA-binding response OmpR family regulator